MANQLFVYIVKSNFILKITKNKLKTILKKSEKQIIKLLNNKRKLLDSNICECNENFKYIKETYNSIDIYFGYNINIDIINQIIVSQYINNVLIYNNLYKEVGNIKKYKKRNQYEKLIKFLKNKNEKNCVVCITLIQTTYIGYKEYNRLFGISDILKYIKEGGVLSRNLFYDKTHTDEYINTSIVDNIINSIVNADDDKRYSELYELNEENKLHKIIQQMIQNTNNIMTLNVINGIYKNRDYGLAIKNLRKEDYDYNKNIDEIEITKNVAEKLKIYIDKINATNDLLELLNKFLIKTCVLKKYEKFIYGVLKTVYIFNQVGLRYNQSKTLINILLTDEKFDNIEQKNKNIFIKKVIEAVEEDLIENEVLNMCIEIKPKNVLVTQVLDNGELDMVIAKNNYMDVYEIKRSKEINEAQYRWLIDEEMESHYKKYILGKKIRNRIVLYRGNNKIINVKRNDGKKVIIQYKNVEKYLKALDEKNIF